MIDFVGREDSTLDRKGRCIVPAPYRRQIVGQSLYLRPSIRGRFLEAWPASGFEADAAPRLGPLDIPTEEEDQRLYALIADVVPVTPDADGRIVLPDHLVEEAGLGPEIVFVGRRSFLEIWSRPVFAEFMRGIRAGLARRPASAAP